MTVLSDELSNDPLGRGYSTMTDEEAASDLNTAYRSRIKSSMSGDEIFTQTDAAEFAGLTDHKRLAWVSWTGKDSIDPSNSVNVDYVKWVFGNDSTTVSNLAAAREESITRATELGLGRVREGEIQMARA
jgi:hypothetical protein